MYTPICLDESTKREKPFNQMSNCKVYFIPSKNFIIWYNYVYQKGSSNCLSYCVSEEKVKKLYILSLIFMYLCLKFSSHLRYKHEITDDSQFVKPISKKIVNNSNNAAVCFSCHKEFGLKGNSYGHRG